MSNNAPDYEDTWTELVKWAKGIKGAKVYNERIVASNLEFLQSGEIYLALRVFDVDGEPVNIRVAENRTPEQMKAIIESLEG